MNTRFGALALIALLVLSTMAFAIAHADDTNGGTSDQNSGTTENSTDTHASENSTDTRTSDNSTSDSGRKTTRSGEKAGGRPAAGNNTLKAVINDWRTQVRERVLEFKNARSERRQNMEQAKQDFQESRQRMIQARDDVLKCKGDNSTACDDTRKNAKLQSQETLMAAADEVIAVLNALKEQTQANTGLTDDEKTAAIADIDKQITALQSASDTIANLNEDSDGKAYLDAAKVIRQAWRDARPVVHESASMLAYGELKAVTDAVDRMSSRIDDQIARFKAQGVDVSAIETLKTDFDKSVASAKTHLDNAKAAYTGMTADNVDAQIGTVRDEMNAARDALQQAHDTLKEIVKDLRTAAQAAKPAGNESAPEGNATI